MNYSFLANTFYLIGMVVRIISRPPGKINISIDIIIFWWRIYGMYPLAKELTSSRARCSYFDPSYLVGTLAPLAGGRRPDPVSGGEAGLALSLGFSSMR